MFMINTLPAQFAHSLGLALTCVTGTAATGGTIGGTAERVARQAWHWFCAVEHAVQSLCPPLVVAAPQMTHLPMFMINALPAQFAHSLALAEEDTRTIASASNAAVAQHEGNLLISHLCYSLLFSDQNELRASWRFRLLSSAIRFVLCLCNHYTPWLDRLLWGETLPCIPPPPHSCQFTGPHVQPSPASPVIPTAGRGRFRPDPSHGHQPSVPVHHGVDGFLVEVQLLRLLALPGETQSRNGLQRARAQCPIAVPHIAVLVLLGLAVLRGAVACRVYADATLESPSQSKQRAKP